MDFHSLSRRELQALCKRNKIPANVTNVAMADSLKALEIVEGIDEVLQACKSEKGQSSIEPRVRLEVTSPYAPPTSGRSTSRRNATEKMDSVMKKCSQDEKKDVLLTPAPTGVTSRRRRAAKEDSAVKQIHGTRRSARLAEKSERLLKGVGNDTDFSKKDLFITGDARECKMNLNESLNSLDEMSGVTSVDENSERKDKEQVDSAEKHDVSTNAEPVLTIEGEMGNHSETERLTVESVKLLNEVGIENPDVLKKELATDDCQKLLKESQDGLEGVAGLDDDSEKKGEAQVDSAEEQNVLIDEDSMPTIENDGAKFKLKEERVDGSQSFVFAGVDANTMEEVNSEQKDEPEFEEKELVPTVDEEYHSNIDDVKTELNEEFKPAAVAPKNIKTSTMKNEAFPHIFTGSDDPSLIIQPTLSTPKRASASKAYARRTRITAASNNKENVGSGSRTAPTKERIKMVKEEALPMLQLSKNLKELNITPKLDKNEGENEVSARAALQALPENQKVE